MYPEVEDERSDNEKFEHPMTAVGVVLLSAALLGTVDGRYLRAFTGYSDQFLAAIAMNMLNNRLWTIEAYDHSTWLLQDGTIKKDVLWEHIEIACGELWLENAYLDVSSDPCEIYWGERGGLHY
jgi:hypothetical protein